MLLIYLRSWRARSLPNACDTVASGLRLAAAMGVPAKLRQLVPAEYSLQVPKLKNKMETVSAEIIVGRDVMFYV